MAKHTIRLSELQDYKFSHEVAGFYGEGEAKTLLACVSLGSGAVSYRVLSHAEVQINTAILQRAIDCYNEL